MDVPTYDTFATNIRQYDGVERCHSHAHHQIILPINGILELEIEGKYGEVGGGQGAVVPSNFRHAFNGIGENRFVVVDLPALSTTVGDQSDGLRRFLEIPNFFMLDQGLYHYTQLVFSEVSRGVDDPRLSTRFACLLAELLARREQSARRSIRPVQRFEPVVKFINSHFDEDIPVRDLAALCHLSVGRFHAAFRSVTGRTPIQYLTEMRMHRASTLLIDTVWSIGRIAAAVGYSSQAAFTHAFKRHFGISPGCYRSRSDAPVPDASVALRREDEARTKSH